MAGLPIIRFGAEIGPHSLCQKYGFFPIPDQKIPIWPSLIGPNKLQMYQLKNSIKSLKQLENI